MTANAELERVYQQVKLIRGVGDRKQGKLCIMSFVALLAGESHSDRPVTASPLITRFAIHINDAMPEHVRQRLKAFAPCILGTRDGHDNVRARTLLDLAQRELFPRISADFSCWPFGRPGLFSAVLLPFAQPSLAGSYQLVLRMALCGLEKGQPDCAEETAVAVARLIACCGRRASTPARREWYWLKAIDLLDRLCDINPDREPQSVPGQRLEVINQLLGQTAQRAASSKRRTEFSSLGL